jgi:transposase-like protein
VARFGKAIVFGLLERKTGKVRTKVVSTRRKGELVESVRENVRKGSEVMTDELLSYDGLNSEYAHQVINHAEQYVDGAVHTNGMENFWSLLKRSIKGTYVSVEPFHLFRYLDEQSFRFNERHDTDAQRFAKVLNSVGGKRLMWKSLTSQEVG